MLTEFCGIPGTVLFIDILDFVMIYCSHTRSSSITYPGVFFAAVNTSPVPCSLTSTSVSSPCQPWHATPQSRHASPNTPSRSASTTTVMWWCVTAVAWWQRPARGGHSGCVVSLILLFLLEFCSREYNKSYFSCTLYRKKIFFLQTVN